MFHIQYLMVQAKKVSVPSLHRSHKGISLLEMGKTLIVGNVTYTNNALALGESIAPDNHLGICYYYLQKDLQCAKRT